MRIPGTPPCIQCEPPNTYSYYAPSHHLGIYRLSIGIDLQPLLRHRRILQKVQRHPYKMPSYTIKLLLHLHSTQMRRIEMSLLVIIIFLLGVGNIGCVVVEVKD